MRHSRINVFARHKKQIEYSIINIVTFHEYVAENIRKIEKK